MRRARERQIEKDARRSRRLARRAALTTGAALGATVLFAPAAQADTFTVSTLDDDGPGSLRQAIADANALAGGDDVAFQAGLSGTIELTSGELAIDEALDVNGPGAGTITISGGDSSRIFEVQTSELEPVLISGLTLADGRAEGKYSDGGAVSFNDAALTIADSVIRDSYASSNGGGIYSDDGGSLTVTGTTLRDNVAERSGGAIFVDAQDATNRISDSVITGNEATEGDGGGVVFYSLYNPGVIERTTISDNAAGGDAGGFLLYNAASTDAEDERDGTFVMRDSTVSGNDAAGDGGGIDLDRAQNAVRFENSTVSGNSAGGEGGGVHSEEIDAAGEDDGDSADAGSVTFASSTVIGNTADGNEDEEIWMLAEPTGPVGGIYLSEDVMTLQNTVVANNGIDLGTAEEQPPEMYAEGQVGALDHVPTSFALDFSLVENPDSAERSDVTAGSNIIGQDPQLGPLAGNGGPTQTHAPARSGPGVDKGSSGALSADQRGSARPVDLSDVANAGDAADMGAVELQAATSPEPDSSPADAQCAGEDATIVAEPGVATVGTPRRDVIVGTAGADVIRAGAGNDLVCAGDGDDDVGGQAGDDRLLGEGGDDRLVGDAGRDRLAGQDGVDRIAGGAGRDSLGGGGGADRLSGGDAGDRLLGRAGADRLSGGAGNDTLSGNSGNDRLLGGSGEDRMFGREGSDRLLGGDGGDSIAGNAGRDRLSGGEDNDRLFGRGGDDRLSGDGGADRLLGGPGDDGLSGGPGRDGLRGGPGADSLDGGPGQDTCAQDPADGAGSSC